MTPTKIGKYAVVNMLSRGASEEVYLGEAGGRRVAIRVFTAVAGSDRDALVEAARKIAGLSHPNIALQEIGVHEDQPFLVAELSGTALDRWLGDSQSLANQLGVIEGVIAGLSHAHEHGVFHRALTPGSILVTSEGDARVWNFGFSMVKAERSALPYVAPEIVEGLPATAQSDIYSAGLVFYEMLTGKAPVAADQSVAKPIRDLKADVPRDLSDAIMACRERAPDWRPKDLSYLLEVVRKLRGTAGPRTRQVPPPTMATAPALRRPAPDRGGPPLVLIAGIAVLLVGGGAAFYFLRGPSATPTTASSAPTTTAPPATAPEAAATPAASSAPTTAPAATTLPTATPTPPPTPAPTATPPPSSTAATPATTPPTTAPPATTPTTTLPPATTAPPAPPVSQAAAPSVVKGVPLLRALSPPMLKRGQTMLVDVRGTDLYAQLAPTLLKGKGAAPGLRVARQRFVNDTLIQVFIEVDAQAAPGAYAIVLSDGGNSTNTLRFDIAK